jgi:hypothetical protein
MEQESWRRARLVVVASEAERARCVVSSAVWRNERVVESWGGRVERPA